MATYNLFDSPNADDCFTRTYYAKWDAKYLLVEHRPARFSPGVTEFRFAGIEDGNEWVTFNAWKGYDSGSNYLGLNVPPVQNVGNIYLSYNIVNHEEIWTSVSGFDTPKCFSYTYGYWFDLDVIDYLYERLKPVNVGGNVWKYAFFSHLYYADRAIYEIGDMFDGGASPQFSNNNPGIDIVSKEIFTSGLVYGNLNVGQDGTIHPTINGNINPDNLFQGTNLDVVFFGQKVDIGPLPQSNLSTYTPMAVSHPAQSGKSYDIYTDNNYINTFYNPDKTNITPTLFSDLYPFDLYSKSGVYPWTTIYPEYPVTGIIPYCAYANNLITQLMIFDHNFDTTTTQSYYGNTQHNLDNLLYYEDVWLKRIRQSVNVNDSTLYPSGYLESLLYLQHPITNQYILNNAPSAEVISYVISNTAPYNIANTPILSYQPLTIKGVNNEQHNSVSGLIEVGRNIMSVASGIIAPTFGIYSILGPFIQTLFNNLFTFDSNHTQNPDNVQISGNNIYLYPLDNYLKGNVGSLFYLQHLNPNRQDWKNSLIYSQPGYELRNNKYMSSNTLLNNRSLAIEGEWTRPRQHVFSLSFGVDSNVENWYNATSIATIATLYTRYSSLYDPTFEGGVTIAGTPGTFGYVDGWVQAPIDEIPPYIRQRSPQINDGYTFITSPCSSGNPLFYGPTMDNTDNPHYNTPDISFIGNSFFEQDKRKSYCLPFYYQFGTNYSDIV